MIGGIFIIEFRIFVVRVEKRIFRTQAEQSERAYKFTIYVFHHGSGSRFFYKVTFSLVICARKNLRNCDCKKLVRADAHIFCPFAVLAFKQMVCKRIIIRAPEIRLERLSYSFCK